MPRSSALSGCTCGARFTSVLGLLLVMGSTATADDWAERRAHIADLQPEEQQELLRKQERFRALPAEEQERLRAFQSAIDADKDSEQLQKVLARYHEWLKTLTPSQRAELADLPPAERVAQIKRLQRQQQSTRDKTHRTEVLTRQDMREVVRWLEELVWARRKTIVAEMPSSQKKRFEKSDPQWQKRLLMYAAFDRTRRGQLSGLASVEQKDVDRLAKQVSEPARDELQKAEDLEAKRKLVGTWIGTAMHRTGSWQMQRRPVPLVEEELVQFLQNEVPPPERERLLKMPREQMLDEVRGRYFERVRSGAGRPGHEPPPWMNGKSERSRGRYPGKGPPPRDEK